MDQTELPNICKNLPCPLIFGISERNVFESLKNIVCTKDHKFGLLNIESELIDFKPIRNAGHVWSKITLKTNWV